MFFKKMKMSHQVTENSFFNHLETMRANYHENPVVSKSLPKPLWIRLHKNDGLRVVYQDKDLIFREGQIYYASIVQANSMLFEKNKLNLSANILFSTHPIAEKHPEFLISIGRKLFSFKDMPQDEVPEHLREMARIITDELDRSGVDFTVSFPDPDAPDKIIEDIDVHFRSVIVFYDDIPGQVLQGDFLPVLALPERSDAVIILPKEYWTLPYYTEGDLL